MIIRSKSVRYTISVQTSKDLPSGILVGSLRISMIADTSPFYRVLDILAIVVFLGDVIGYNIHVMNVGRSTYGQKIS